MSFQLIGPKESTRNWKIFIVAKYVGVQLETAPFTFGEDNKKPEFLRKNPVGKVPVLETPEGYVFESNAIAKYLALQDKNRTLLGRSTIEEAQVDQWIDFSMNELEPNIMTWLGPIWGYIDYEQEAHTRAVANLKKAFEALNRFLENHTYLVGERLSLADIITAALLVSPYKLVLDARFRAPFPHVNRWFECITSQENFQEVVKIDNAQWCVVSQQAKKKAPAQKAPETKETAKAEEKPAAAEAKPKDKKAHDDDDEEEEEEAEERKKNPLDALPKSAFVMDELKRFFSNHPLDVAVPWLYEKFDPEGYTMWYCSYKYNDELKQAFMTSNLVRGFLQRMESMRKYSFGQINIYGPEEKQSIYGFWIIRSKEIPQSMLDVDDVELYDWIKIENPAAEKAKITTILAKEPLDGKEVLDAKTFK